MELPVLSFHIRSSPTATDDPSHLATILLLDVPTDSGCFSCHVANDYVVLQDSYSEVILNIVGLTFDQYLFSNVGRPL